MKWKWKILLTCLLAAVAFWIVAPAVSSSSVDVVGNPALALVAEAEQVASEIDSGGPYRAELASVQCKVNENAVGFAMVIGNKEAAQVYSAIECQINKNEVESAISTVTKKMTMQARATDVDIGPQNTLRADMANGYERAAEIIEMAKKMVKKKTKMMAVLLISPAARTLAQNDAVLVPHA